MSKTFSIGGIHPHDNKISANQAIESFPIPAVAYISMAQHLGAPAVPVVQKGDYVRVGQIIGKASGFISAHIHASVSGTVKSVEPFVDVTGKKAMTVVIEVQGDEWMEEIDRTSDIVRTTTFSGPVLTGAEIIQKVAQCGVVGLGGATFPTHVKLSPPPEKKATCLILNGAECEPFLTSDYRMMMEQGEEVLIGAQLMMRALDVHTCYVGIEDNKPQAIRHLSVLAKAYPGIEVVTLQKKYPQGGEKQLIDAVVKRQVPSRGLPVDVGAVVQNVGTALAVYEAVQKNKPLIEKVITVTGLGVKAQKNYRVRVGVPLSALVEAVGGVPEGAAKIVLGGPMMGLPVAHIEAPVVKGSSAILFLSEKEAKRRPETPCIRCGKCVEACPIGLEPYLLYKLGKVDDLDGLELNKVYDCIECGCCLYSCPAYVPLLDLIRLYKGRVLGAMRKRGG